MAMTREEAWQKRDLYDSRLTDRDFVKANKYAWWSFCCLGVCWVLAFIFVGIGININGLDFLISLGVVGITIGIGLYFIYEAKAAMIRKYYGSQFFSDNGGGNLVFDDRAIKLAKFNLVLGYLLIALGIGVPLLLLVFILFINKI